MTAEKTAEKSNFTFYQNPAIDTTRGREDAVYLGNVLHTLSTLFGRSTAPGPDAMFLVETMPHALLREATESMAAQLHVPLIVADAEFGIDQVMGAPVGRIESTGDSLFRKIADTAPGVLVIEDINNMRGNDLKIFNHLASGKTLRLPDMDKPVDLKGWTIVMSAPKDADIDPELKRRAAATIDLENLLPKP